MPDKDVNKILKDLELKAVGLDPTSNRMQEGYFVSFRPIGLPIRKEDYEDPWSPTKISGSQKAYTDTFLLTNHKLALNSEYDVMPGSSTVHDSWLAIISGANAIPTSDQPSAELQAALDAERAKLFDSDGNIMPHYDAYKKHEKTYQKAKTAWNVAYASTVTDPAKLASWPITGTQYEDDANEAMSDWIAVGFKEEIESARDTLAAQGTDPSVVLIKRSKLLYQNSLNEFQNFGQLPYTLLEPSTWYDADNDDGWNEYTSTDFHTESHSAASSSSSQGGGGGSWGGFWSGNAGASHDEQHSEMGIKTDDLKISFNYCIVDIERPWLDTSLLNLSEWFLKGDYKKNCISNGTMQQQVPDGGTETTFLPSLVTSLILIKDLKLYWSSYEADSKAMQATTTESASVGWGPFSVSESHTEHASSSDSETNFTDEGLVIPGIQLVGYVSAINPASPGKDSKDFMTTAKPAVAGAAA